MTQKSERELYIFKFVPFYASFLFSSFLQQTEPHLFYKILSMTGFELPTFGVGSRSNRSAN